MIDRDLALLEQADPVAERGLAAYGPPEQLAAILAADRRPPARRARPRRVALAAVAAAGAIAAAVALLPTGSEQASPAAARALRSVAGVASAQAAEPTGYLYFKLLRSDVASADSGGGFTWTLPRTIEQWAAADGSGRVREVPRAQRFVGPRDERRWLAGGSPPLGLARPSDERFAAGELDNTTPGAENLRPTRDLPTDPSALSDAIRAAADKSEEVPTSPKMFEIASALLMQAGATPRLRASLYEVVAGIDGVKLDGNVRDPLGRPGTAVSIDYDYSGVKTRDTLIFDPSTSQPLAQRSVLLGTLPTRDGDENGSTVVLRSGQVSTPTERP
jgi:hypothetical protein